MKFFFNEGNQIHNFISSSGSGTVFNYGSGSGSDFLTNYGFGSSSTSVPRRLFFAALQRIAITLSPN